jgi:hypothetical protein
MEQRRWSADAYRTISGLGLTGLLIGVYLQIMVAFLVLLFCFDTIASDLAAQFEQDLFPLIAMVACPALLGGAIGVAAGIRKVGRQSA